MTDFLIVTGAAGFIGCNLVEALNKRGYDNLLLVDHLGSSQKWRNLVGLKYSDYLDRQAFIEQVDKGQIPYPKMLFHLGACSSTIETDCDYLVENNYRYSRRLAQWCVGSGSHMIMASSAATYGDGALGYDDDVSRLDLLRPLNMYGYSKHLFDKWAVKAGAYSQRLVGLKFFNVYGPHEDHKGSMRSMVWKAYQQICETGKVKLFKSERPEYADGFQQRDFVYVEDAVKVMLHFFDHPELSGLYNCGSGRASSWVELVTAVFKSMGREPQIEFVEMPRSIAANYQYYTKANTHKLRSTGGYSEEFMSVEDGVAKYVTEYLLKGTWVG